MLEIPNSLEMAIDQARSATRTAIESGLTRLQVEMVIPELKQQPIAEQFLQIFADMGLQFRVLFPDAGAAALAKRDWNNPDFIIRGINESRGGIDPDDEALLIVNPSAVEVADVEKTCNEALDRPVVLLNPQLEDVSIIGIGYAGRQLRERFLSTLDSIYYFRPLEGAAVFRCYPQGWQVWRETAPNRYEFLVELPQRPSGEALDNILYADSAAAPDSAESAPTPALSEPSRKPKRGLLSELQQFIRALTQ